MADCLRCGAKFAPRNTQHLYCSKKCMREKNKVCPTCNKEFVAANKSRTYCSRLCADIGSGKTVVTNCGACGKEIHKKRSHADYYKTPYCSKECHDKAQVKRIIVTCQNCGKDFKTLPNPVDRRMYCSNKCKHLALMIEIPESELRELYVEQDMTTREIADIFNTNKTLVLRNLRRYGVKTKSSGFNNCEKIKCTDGHMVKSHYERALDNALARHGIPHEYEPRLSFSRRHSADFLVGDVYVEVWGMCNWNRYAERKSRKMEIYRKNGARLLSVYPEDFRNVNKIITDLKALLPGRFSVKDVMHV